eukprot:680351-Lingulodinium_polyedra.AAC.1
MRSCQLRNRSFAVLFVDLAQALYSAIRELIYGTAICDERFPEHLVSLGCPQGAARGAGGVLRDPRL